MCAGCQGGLLAAKADHCCRCATPALSSSSRLRLIERSAACLSRRATVASVAQDGRFGQVWPWAGFRWDFPDLYALADIGGTAASECAGPDPYNIPLGCAVSVPLGIFGHTRLVARSAPASVWVYTSSIIGMPVFVRMFSPGRPAHFYVPLEHVGPELLVQNPLAFLCNFAKDVRHCARFPVGINPMYSWHS